MLSKNILVTGGAGYIGSHTCKALAESGYQPVAYDNLVAGHEWAVKWGPLEVGDIADCSRLDEVIAEYRPSAVIHFPRLPMSANLLRTRSSTIVTMSPVP